MKKIKKLGLARETVRLLGEELAKVRGAGVCSTSVGTRISDCHCPTQALNLCPQETDGCAPNTLERNCA